MPSGEHSHYEKYFTRIIKEYRPLKGRDSYQEVLELICEYDGLVFHRVDINYPKDNRS